MEHLDVLIVGGGPAGLSGALMLGRARRRVTVVDAGRPRNAMAQAMHGYLSRDGINPHEFLKIARTDLTRYGVDLVTDEVTSIEKVGSLAKTAFIAETKGRRRFSARKVLFATGTCDDVPDLPGVAECYGSSVHHCPYCDGWEYRDQRLLAFSHDPQKAVGLGLLLRGWSAHVTALTNGASASMEDRSTAAANGVDLVEIPVAQLLHAKGRLYRVDFDGGGSIAADALFFNTGQSQACDLPQMLGCRMERPDLLAASDRQRSNVPGVFLAGDAEGDVQFVIVAAAEGAKAAVAINAELQQEDRAA